MILLSAMNPRKLRNTWGRMVIVAYAIHTRGHLIVAHRIRKAWSVQQKALKRKLRVNVPYVNVTNLH